MNETIDIDDLVATISAGIYGDDRMSWRTIEAATTALSQLVAEVERLRAERAPEARPRSSGHHSKCVWGNCQGGCHDLFYDGGEHRREEE